MLQPSRRKLDKALDFLIEATALPDPESLVRHLVRGLPSLVDSEITTLGLCDAAAGTRQLTSIPGDAITAGDIAAFSRVIGAHPPVRCHAVQRRAGAWRIADSVGLTAFRDSPGYAKHYRGTGVDPAAAAPVIASPRPVMRFVLNRRGGDVAERDIALLERLRPALANLCRFALARPAPAGASGPRPGPLTAREEEVLSWVAAGKSDRQVAAIVGLSVRTVQKHLANAYVKLGVENRTAAAMRLEALRRAIAVCAMG
jgi:DNA-binding CsgD family transcriptional regulator